MKNRLIEKVSLCAVVLLFLLALTGCGTTSEKPKGPAETPVDSTPITKETPAPAKPGVPAQPTPPVKPTTRPKAPEEPYFFHTVKWPGETVSIIAGWYTGSIQNWKTLADANPDINPQMIHVGMRIRVPERLMTNSQPMTKDYVDRFYAKPKTKETPPTTPPENEDGPTLIGPKEFTPK